MTTKVGMQSNFLDAVKDLIELEYDAIEAYNSAIDKLENINYKNNLSTFREDHKRHVRELSDFLKKQGKTPPTGPTGKQWITKGKVVLANLLGDNTILKAMSSNEEDTNDAYKRMNERKDKHAELQSILKKGLEDEIRHKRWLDEILESVNF